jgi:5'-nucleotidase (lipoprotein e(P4) family)
MIRINKKRATACIVSVSTVFIITTCLLPKIDSDDCHNQAMLMAILWRQKSAEYRALAYQSFNIARVILDRESKIPRKKKKAVVVDIDETVLDTSPYHAKTIIENKHYPAGWDEWCNRASALEVPGAGDFLRSAVAMGFDVFYISNRSERIKEKTIENLKKLGFPQARTNHVLLRRETPSKKSRREQIEKTHHIVLLLGDNLNDFSEIFEGKSIIDRFAQTDAFKNHFGRHFVILPNPIYGDWEGALYQYRKKVPAQQKNHIRKEHLEHE